MLRRCIDVAISGIALVASAPLIAAVSVAIKLESPGPTFYLQTRVGRRRRPIRVAKFRTMVDGAERHGPSITAAGDPRVTRVGALLRKTKLDELPQLWNVLRGDMTLVGPRPEVPRYVAHYRPEWEPVFEVPPGLTDLASLTFRDEEGLLSLAVDRERAYQEVVMPMKLVLALETIARRSLVNDLAVIVKTLEAIVRPHALDREPVLQEARRRIERLNADGAR